MKSIVVGTAGHIDHGKSTLVRALTGTDPDRLKEEQDRGITIDLGFAHLQRGQVNFAFVDVPGHERFVKNMLAGAGGIDLVVLVVAADESVMPQTREHFEICRLLGVSAGVIVLTKTDLVEREMLDLVSLEVRELTAGSFLADAPIVPVSAKTGEGLDAVVASLEALAGRAPGRNVRAAARLPIDRVFTMRGFGTVVTGTLVAGTIDEEQELVILPRERRVKVRGIQVHGRTTGRGLAGQRVAVNLGGVDVAEIARGDVLCEPDLFEPTTRLDAAIELLADARPLRHGTRVRFHCGTSELLGRVAIAAVRSTEHDAAEVPPGASAYVRVRLEAPALVTRGDRFIMRAYSPPATIGGGIVLDPAPPRGAIRTAAGLARFRRIDLSPVVDEAVAAFVEERGRMGLPRRMLVSRAGLSEPEAAAVIERLAAAGRIATVGDLLLAPAVLEELTTALVALVHAHHRAEPLSDGLPREEARERLFRRASPEVFEHVLERLVADGRLVARDRLALSEHQVSLSPEEARVKAAIERVYRDAGYQPPDLTAAAASAGADLATAERMVKLLLRSRTLVRVDTLLFHAETLEGLKADVRAMKGAGRVDVATFKERYGVTRKYAIPLLEYLDRERLTRRVGDSRMIL